MLKIDRIINHPKYTLENGPILGYDIAIYHVDDEPLKQLLISNSALLDPLKIYPICLPRRKESDYLTKNGILSTWRDPRPQYFSQNDQKETAIAFRLKNILLRQVQMEKVRCEDPTWMNSNTYYPQGFRKMNKQNRK